MPLPEPRANEKKETFIARCMKSITLEERDKWPDEKQRAAICYSQWDKWQTEHGHPEKAERPAEKKAAAQKKNAGGTGGKTAAGKSAGTSARKAPGKRSSGG